MKLINVVCFLVFSAGFATAFAAPFTPGNLLYQTQGTLIELTVTGEVVQTFEIEAPVPDWRTTEYARDISVLDNDRVFVYNGTFDPYLSAYSISENRWDHWKDAAMWTVNNGSYGGIAHTEEFVFATSMSPSSAPNGAVRFSQGGGFSDAMELDISAIDLTIGLNGLLYILSPGGSPSGRFVNIFDPDNLLPLGDINLSAIFGHTGHRAIAVNQAGELFVADWDGDIQKVSNDGNVLSATNICAVGDSCNLYDIDVSQSGQLVVTSRAGDVYLLDDKLDLQFHFDATEGFAGGFASFIPPSNFVFSQVADIGYTATPSEFAYDDLSNTYTLEAAGVAIGGWVDYVSMIYAERSSNVDFIARLADIEKGWALGGIMIRESLHSGSPFAAIGLEKNEGAFFKARDSLYQFSDTLALPDFEEGMWMRLTADDSNVEAFISDDGVTWEIVGNIELILGEGFYIGLMGATVESAATTAITFDDIIVR